MHRWRCRGAGSVVVAMPRRPTARTGEDLRLRYPSLDRCKPLDQAVHPFVGPQEANGREARGLQAAADLLEGVRAAALRADQHVDREDRTPGRSRVIRAHHVVADDQARAWLQRPADLAEKLDVLLDAVLVA